MRKVLYILGLMTDQDLDWMETAGERRRLPAGTVLIEQNRISPSLFFVLDGTVAVEIEGVGEVARLGCGAMFGEMPIIDRRLPSAGVRAVRDCVVLELAVGAVAARLDADAGFSARFHRGVAHFLSDRLRISTARLHPGAPRQTDAELDIESLSEFQRAGHSFGVMLKKLMNA